VELEALYRASELGGPLPATPLSASFSKDEIEKQIEESKSLRFGSATFWNTFL
jgi:hypothetical protein